FQTDSSIVTPALYLTERSQPVLITNSHKLAFVSPGYPLKVDTLTRAVLNEDTGTVNDGTIKIQGNRTIAVSVAADGTITRSPNRPAVTVSGNQIILGPIVNTSSGVFHETSRSVTGVELALGSGKCLFDASLDSVTIDNYSDRDLNVNGIDPV